MIDRDIKEIKKHLIEKAKKNGLYENFGQAEIRYLRDRYGEGGSNFENLDKINVFDNWCNTYQE